MCKHKVHPLFFVNNFVSVSCNKNFKLKTQMAETKEVTRPMDKLRDRYVSKYPDKDYSGENAEDALVADVLAELEGYDALASGEFEEGRAQSQKMVELFNRDPRSSKFMLALASGEGNPIDYLLTSTARIFLMRFRARKEELRLLRATTSGWRRRLEESTMQGQGMDNYEKSINDLVAFASEKGISQTSRQHSSRRLTRSAWMLSRESTPESPMRWLTTP